MTNQPHTFDNFLEDSSNRIALATCKNVLEWPGEQHNPLWLYGSPGCGKSHLLESLYNHFHRFLHDNVVYITAEDALDAFLSTIDGPSEIWDAVQCCDVLLLDAVEYLDGKHSTCDLFGEMITKKVKKKQQVVLASCRTPDQLCVLWHALPKKAIFTAEIHQPDLQLRMRYAREYLRLYPFDISQSALEHLVENTVTFQGVEGTLNTGRLWCELYNQPLTLSWMQNYVFERKR